MKKILHLAFFLISITLVAQITQPKPPGSSNGNSSSITTPKVPTTNTTTTTSTKSISSDCVSGDCNNGFGKQEYGTGYYEGFFTNGMPNGPGYETYPNGYYLGFYNNGKREGFGNYGWNDTKDLYRGMWKLNERDGYGYILDGENLLKSAGIYRNSAITVNEGLDYINNVRSTNCVGNCLDGYGAYTWENGDKYNGFFRNGKRVDFGTYAYPDGGMYHGQFSNGSRHGQGSYLWASGDFYIGGWSNGKRHGKGIYYYKNGTTKHGTWSEDTFIN
ncbi:hypothetical protein [Rasiella sp. SM2506]|uniref:hypothetical protein n=1 Tax=Rasiella sp. SM2506 TaxID=3423914 RepID=UPI003D7A58A2